MKFFYNLEKVEGYEYVVLKVQDEKSNDSGVGAILPLRKKGENYKIFMGVIEEYRTIVEHSKLEDVFSICDVLTAHFPNHPKVVFAIQSAMISLFSKKYKLDLNSLLGSNIKPKNEKFGELVFPEELGDVFLSKYWAKFKNSYLTFVMTKYPKNEMEDILSALSTNYKYLEVVSWRELL
ncbi:MAG: hypothetical protein ACK4MM_00535 [Fervidobacterium sp.]